MKVSPGNVILSWLPGYPGCLTSKCTISYYEVTAKTSGCTTVYRTSAISVTLFDSLTGQFIFSPCSTYDTGSHYSFNVVAVNEVGKSFRVELSTFIGELAKLFVICKLRTSLVV